MPKRKSVPTVEEGHSAEFKLRVVLEYVRSPKKKKRICQENKISEKLLAQWHQEFLERASLVFSENPSSTSNAQTPNPKSNRIAETKTDMRVAETLPSWGIHLNKGTGVLSQSISSVPEPPKWLSAVAREEWKNNRGVIIWDDVAQKSEVLGAERALGLLQNMRQNDQWRTEGLGITRRVWRLNLSDEPKHKRSRKKGVQDKPVAKEHDPTLEEAEEEWIHLNTQAAIETFGFLQQHEDSLKQMAEEDHTTRVQALARVYSTILSWEPKEG